MSYFANRSDSRFSQKQLAERKKKIESVIDSPSPLINSVQRSFEKNRNAKSIILSDLWTPLEGLTIDLTRVFGHIFMYNIKDKILYVPYTFPSGYSYRKPLNVDKAK